ncbi:hypothetical protein E1A91_D08G102500v1 [Gossypium mustelinum]|uniref:Homeobox-leucine zipper protein n=1 Tax=Gossypium mustelinum TaxID=34275 RepID=A0A5D2TW57_GOSMU|nr:hypothetical protein E1A91_D08G102500v1 [Gossypium mustelinum]
MKISTKATNTIDYAEENSSKKHQIYSKEFQAMLDGLDEEDSLEEGGQATEKKRRLSMHQVKALEKNFDVGNKLEPERKVKLAEELGLQPRQVAIWFQNRRARWKTKVLEKDYAMLKANREKEPPRNCSDCLHSPSDNRQLSGGDCPLVPPKSSPEMTVNGS